MYFYALLFCKYFGAGDAIVPVRGNKPFQRKRGAKRDDVIKSVAVKKTLNSEKYVQV